MIAGHGSIVQFRLTVVVTVAVALTGCGSSQQDALATAAQAQQMLDANQIAQAQQLIARAVGERDDVAGIYLAQAHIANAAGNRSGAYQAYANALALEATNAEALVGVAQSGVGTGHLRESERAADQILTLEPGQPQALAVKAIAAIVRNKYDVALDYADQVLAVAPQDVTGLILKSRALALSGDRQQALAVMQAGVVKTGYTPDITMSLTELYRATEEAEPYFAMLLRLRQIAPDNLDYRLDLVDALYRRGQRDAARGEVVALLTPQLKEAGDLDRIVRLWQGYDVEALTPALLQQASTGMSTEARLAIARYLIATGRAATAAALVRPLATGWSNDIQAVYARAADAAGTSVGDAADRILAKDSDNGDALLLRARQSLAAGSPNRAIIDLQRVVTDYPQWDDGYLALAGAYAAAGQPVGLRRTFEAGLRVRPQSYAMAARYIGRLPTLGDAARAVEVARRLALGSPSSIRAWQLYADTCRKWGGGDCAMEATSGLARSRTRFGLDPTPGTPPPIALIGRLT